MKAYITTDALQGRIYTLEGDTDKSFPGMFVAMPEGDYSSSYFREGEWHLSKEAAVSHAESMRDLKIASLEKQIEKLKKMKFD